jgi:hypothetical protein
MLNYSALGISRDDMNNMVKSTTRENGNGPGGIRTRDPRLRRPVLYPS